MGQEWLATGHKRDNNHFNIVPACLQQTFPVPLRVIIWRKRFRIVLFCTVPYEGQDKLL